MEIFSIYGKVKMIDMPVERNRPNLSQGHTYVEFEHPVEAQKVLKQWRYKSMAKKSQPLLCWPPGLGHPWSNSGLPECCHRLPCGAGHPPPPMDEDKIMLPQAQVLMPSRSHFHGCSWLQLLLVSSSLNLHIPYISHATQFYHCSSQRRISRKEIPLRHRLRRQRLRHFL